MSFVRGLQLLLLHCSAFAADFASMRRMLLSGEPCSPADHCNGQPPPCGTYTPLLGTTRPGSALQTYNLTFRNAGAWTVQLFWLEPNGTERAFTTIGSGERRAVRTYTGDAWRARALHDVPRAALDGIGDAAPTSGSASDSTVLMEMQVGPATIRDCGCTDVPLVRCPPRTPGKHNATSRPEYEPAGFINAADSDVHLYLWAGGCETLLTEGRPLAPGQQSHLASWAGQQFRARRTLDDALLLTHTVGQVLIRDCQRRGNGGFGDGIFGSDSAAQMALAAGAETVAGLRREAAALSEQLAAVRREQAAQQQWASRYLKRLTAQLLRQLKEQERTRRRLDALEAALEGRAATNGDGDGGSGEGEGIGGNSSEAAEVAGETNMQRGVDLIGDEADAGGSSGGSSRKLSLEQFNDRDDVVLGNGVDDAVDVAAGVQAGAGAGEVDSEGDAGDVNVEDALGLRGAGVDAQFVSDSKTGSRHQSEENVAEHVASAGTKARAFQGSISGSNNEPQSEREVFAVFENEATPSVPHAAGRRTVGDAVSAESPAAREGDSNGSAKAMRLGVAVDASGAASFAEDQVETNDNSPDDNIRHLDQDDFAFPEQYQDI